jgi:radical SAM/Cys-rich protein
MLRTNLTLIGEPARRPLLDLCLEQRVVLVGSLPAANASQTDAQRGQGTLDRTIQTIKLLNEAGYGQPGSGLELDLVANPTGAFLPVSQAQAEKKLKRDLQRKWGLSFDNLYTFANVPLGRFRSWLQESGNFQHYMERLGAAFNPCAVEGLMCRSLVSVGWDGYLYDCDFNLALGLPLGGRRTHVSELVELPQEGAPIGCADHCYTCTAGAGFS